MISRGKVDSYSTEHRLDEDKPCCPPLEEILIKSTYCGALFGIPPVPSAVWLHGLRTSGGQHEKAHWLPRVPARLSEQRLSNASSVQEVWGILITEEYTPFVIASTMASVLVLLIAIVWLNVRHLFARSLVA